MAPALVEHSTAKGRNSVSKKFLKNLSYIPQLDLVLGDNLKRVDSSTLLPEKSFNGADMTNNLMPKDTNSFEQKIKLTTTIQGESAPVISCSTPRPSTNNFTFTPSLAEKMDVVQEKIILNQSDDVAGGFSSSQAEACGLTKSEERTHPVALLDTQYIWNRIKCKQESMKVKFYDVNSSISKISLSLQKLRSRNISSFVACHLHKSGHNITGARKFSQDSEKSCLNKKSLGCASINTVDKLLRRQKQKLREIRKIHDIAVFVNEDTDYEEDFDSRMRVPGGHKKRKSAHPPPTPSALHEWKKKRARIGSQCAWLSLQMQNLDRKMEHLNKIHKEIKSERQVNRVMNIDTYDNKELSNDKNGIIPVCSAQSLDDHVAATHGCSRTCPLSMSWSHKYIKKHQLPEAVGGYGCHNLPSSFGCRLCAETRCKNTIHASSSLTEKLDASYHSNLSYGNDISLSFLLEETLRTKKINTKVTITKPTKKKKKIKPKEGVSLQKVEKESEKPKNSFVEVKTISKSKSERSRSDEYSRKRSSTLEYSSSGRLRKLRKFSDSLSCDSSKPSTPTNELASPLSQSLNSSGLFSSFNKNKKKLSSSGDYDINNIVIPYSIAASTRVERIQYKEIPTPGWRNIDGDMVDGETEQERELTDEEVISERHSRCELSERKRFSDYFQPTRRLRPNRVSDGQFSEPPSPVIVDEPTKSVAGTPVDSPNINPLKSLIRSLNITPCVEDEREIPWMTRKFPLPEKEYNDLTIYTELLSPVVSTGGDSKTLASLKQVSHALMRSNNTPRNSPLQSPTSLSSPGTPVDQDSSWTVKLVSDPPIDVVTTEKHRKGIVLKLAKK